MDGVTLYLTLRADAPLDDAAVLSLADVLRPGDEELRIWRESPTLLRVTTDCVAADLDSALELGHALGAEPAALGRGLTVEEVVAMTDLEQLVGRARP